MILNLHYIKGENVKIKEVKILIEPLVPKQNCPCCGSSDVIKKGKNDNRKITHLKIAATPCVLIVPNVKLKCSLRLCLKEQLADWYDCSFDYLFFATASFMKLCALLNAIGKSLTNSLLFYRLIFQEPILVLSHLFSSFF